MDSRSISGLVLDEAADVLGELADWLRTAPVPFAPGLLPRSRVPARPRPSAALLAENVEAALTDVEEAR